MVSGLFDLVLGVRGSAEPEALGIQRSILELELDKFSAPELVNTIPCLDSKLGDDASCFFVEGSFWNITRCGCFLKGHK